MRPKPDPIPVPEGDDVETVEKETETETIVKGDHDGETIDDETVAAAKDFIRRAVKSGEPFFVWWNGTRMHFRTHVKKEHRGLLYSLFDMGIIARRIKILLIIDHLYGNRDSSDDAHQMIVGNRFSGVI